jgi:hypothetical protein
MPRQPSKKRSKAQKEHWQNAMLLGQVSSSPTLEVLPEQPDKQPEGSEGGSEAEDGLTESPKTAQLELVAVTQTLAHTEDLLQAAEQKGLELYHKLRVERRKLQRSLSRKTILEEKTKLLKAAASSEIAHANKLVHHSTAENAALQSKLSTLIEKSIETSSQFTAAKLDFQMKLKESNRQKRNAQKRCHRVPEIKAKAAQRAKQNADKENRIYRLQVKGIYQPQVREMARTLVAAGCAHERVGHVIQTVCKNAGIDVVGNMSRRTVSRTILEGLVAAQVQLGHELTKAEGKQQTAAT